MPKKKHSKVQTLEDSISDGYKPIEKAELVDIIQLRDRWNFDIKNLRCDFDLTYKREHG